MYMYMLYHINSYYYFRVLVSIVKEITGFNREDLLKSYVEVIHTEYN